MKKLLIMFACSLSLMSAAHAQTDTSCTAYSIVTPGSEVACGTGYDGLKFTKTTKTCPDGKVTVSTQYDTSQCKPSSQNTAAAQKCTVNPASCQSAPTPVGCPTNQHWALNSNNVATCVNDTSVSSDSRTVSCPSGYDGTQSQQRTVTTDHYTGIVTYGAWSTTSSSCTVSCSPTYSTSNSTSACQSGYTGSIVTTYKTNSCTGATTSTVSNTCSLCSPTYSTSNSTSACPSGYTGTVTTTYRTNSCTGATTTTSTNNCTVAVCVPTYATSTSTAACASGYSGSITTTNKTNSCTGAVTSTVANNCTPVVCVPTYTTSTSTAACSSGYSGSITTTYKTNSCTGATTSTTANSCTKISPPPRTIVSQVWYCYNRSIWYSVDTWSDGSVTTSPPRQGRDDPNCY